MKVYEIEETDGVLQVGMLSSAKYLEGKGTVQIRFALMRSICVETALGQIDQYGYPDKGFLQKYFLRDPVQHPAT